MLVDFEMPTKKKSSSESNWHRPGAKKRWNRNSKFLVQNILCFFNKPKIVFSSNGCSHFSVGAFSLRKSHKLILKDLRHCLYCRIHQTISTAYTKPRNIGTQPPDEKQMRSATMEESYQDKKETEREKNQERKKERKRWQNHTVIDTTLILPALHDACFQALILWYFSLIVYDDSLTFVAFSQDSSTLPSSAHQETSHKLHHTMNTYNILSQKFSKSLFVHIPVSLSVSLSLSIYLYLSLIHRSFLSIFLSSYLSICRMQCTHYDSMQTTYPHRYSFEAPTSTELMELQRIWKSIIGGKQIATNIWYGFLPCIAATLRCCQHIRSKWIWCSALFWV